MSEEIIRRLRSRSKKDQDYLKESFSTFKVNEADEDEEIPEEDITPPDEELEDIPPVEDEEAPAEEEDPAPSVEDKPVSDNPNPLDNLYAINHSIGDEVAIAYSNGSTAFLKGVIEGYDKEGFYRIKWEDGMITNGITDIAISDILATSEDAKCVCGSLDFLEEGNALVCDKCGRRIKEALIKDNEVDVVIEKGEPFTNDTIVKKLRAAGKDVSKMDWELKSNGYGAGFRDYVATSGGNSYNVRVFRESTDPLTKADKSRPAGKKLIRSEAHPVSTAMKPTLAEAIKDAFKKSSMNESAEEDLAGDYEVDGKPVHIYRTGNNRYSIHDEHGDHDNHNSDSVKAYIKGWKANRVSEAVEDDEENSDIFSPLENLRGEFWTRLPELVDDIEELGFIVEESNAEYVLVSAEDSDTSYALQIPLAGTARTMVLDLDKARKV